MLGTLLTNGGCAAALRRVENAPNTSSSVAAKVDTARRRAGSWDDDRLRHCSRERGSRSRQQRRLRPQQSAGPPDAVLRTSMSHPCAKPRCMRSVIIVARWIRVSGMCADPFATADKGSEDQYANDR